MPFCLSKITILLKSKSRIINIIQIRGLLGALFAQKRERDVAVIRTFKMLTVHVADRVFRDLSSIQRIIFTCVYGID